MDAGDSRARERLLFGGAEALDDEALVAVVLGTGARGRPVRTLAAALLAETGGVRGLGRAGIAALRAVPGVGPGQAARLLAAVELGRRATAAPLTPARPLRSSRDIVAAFGPRIADALEERFYALLLDARLRPMRTVEIARGGIAACPVSPADVFRHALGAGAPKVAFVHNHPSGSPEPSREDIAFTERLIAGGRLLGVQVIDHVIVAREGAFSFLDAGVCLGEDGDADAGVA